jgi:serine/threonine protein kinase
VTSHDSQDITSPQITANELAALGFAATEVASEDQTVAAAAPNGAVDNWCGMGLELRGRHLYRLEHRLGRGGMGSVYRARRVSPGDTLPPAPPEVVAVKLFHPPEGQNSAGLLKRELSSLLALRHDRIPQVYDWNVHSRLAFAAFQYYADGSLAESLAAKGPIEEESAWQLLKDLLSALKAAHLASIVHLDVRPDNVLLDGSGGYVLADFGISQGSMVSRSAVATGLGAAGFRSPEQRRADHSALDTRTDLWGVGITVWTAFTGMQPLQHAQLPQSPDQYHGVPRLSLLRPGCSPELELIVMSLLTNRSTDRPGGAAEVLAQVQTRLKGKGSSAQLHAVREKAPSDEQEAAEIINSLMDPVWFQLCSKPELKRFFHKFEDGELLCEEGEQSYNTFILLKGMVAVEHQQKRLTVETREGTFLGEVTTLTGRTRTATLRALGTVWTCNFNAAELEHCVGQNPAVAIRLIKSLAERVVREREMSGQQQPLP